MNDQQINIIIAEECGWKLEHTERGGKMSEKIRDMKANIVRLLGENSELKRERDEAREHLKAIEEYGTEEINAAVELRSKLAVALVERDEAREKNAKLRYLAERAIEDLAWWWETKAQQLRAELDQLKEGDK